VGNDPVAISWTQTNTWSGVDISLALYNQCADFPFLCGGTTAFGEVFLTDSLGPGTTLANQIAATSLSTSSSGFQTVTAFSGLTLVDGTYYVVFSRVNLGLFWADAGFDPQVIVGDGVTAGPTYFSFGNVDAYPPATSDFVVSRPFDFHPMFAITGTRVETPVPEPSSLFLLGAGLALVARARYRRK
jgi:hypothetical protein